MEKRRHSRKLLNKRGAIWDTIFIAVMLFIGAILTLILLWTMNTVSDVTYGELRQIESEIEGDQNVSGILPKMSASFDATLDFVFLGLLLALLAGGLVASFIVDFHPVFVIFFIIILAIALVVAVPLSNSWMEFTDSGQFTNQTGNLTATDHIMSNLPLYLAAIGFLMIIVMYAKTVRGREEYT